MSSAHSHAHAHGKPESTIEADPLLVLERDAGSPDYHNKYHMPFLDEDGVNPNQSPLNKHSEVQRRGIKTTDQDSRNLPGPAKTRGAMNSLAYTSKESTHTKRHGPKNGPQTNPESDFDFQRRGFASLVPAQMHVSPKLRFMREDGTRPGDDSAFSQQELEARKKQFKELKIDDATMTALHVVEYLENAGITPAFDIDRLAKALRLDKGKLTKDFDKRLNEADMRAHVAYIMRLGRTVVSSLDNPRGDDDTNIPVSAQRRGRIIPTSFRQMRLARKGAKLQKKRSKIAAERVIYGNPAADKLELSTLRRARRKEEKWRRKQMKTFNHHLDHNEHQFEDLAFGKRKLHLAIPKTHTGVYIPLPFNASSKLHKSALRLAESVNPDTDDNLGPTPPLQLADNEAESRILAASQDTDVDVVGNRQTTSEEQPPNNVVSLDAARNKTHRRDTISRNGSVSSENLTVDQKLIALSQDEDDEKKAA